MKSIIISIATMVLFIIPAHSQNIGIGTLSPGQELDVNGDVRIQGGNLHIWSLNGSEGAQINLAKDGINNDGGAQGTNNWAIDVFQNDFRILDLDQVNVADIERLRLTVNGDLGIGRPIPEARLDVAGNVSVNDNKILFRNGGDQNHYIGYLGGSIDGPVLQGNGGVVLRQQSGSFVGQLVLKNNRVGINTDNPTNGLLHINGQYGHDSGNFAYYAGGGSGFAGGGADVSIWATNRIVASEFNAYSDARIKNIVGATDRSIDLNTLMAIEIVNYSKIDKAVDKGVEKKVIAQQVETIFPQAVSMATDFIPNIYQIGEIHDGRVSVANDLVAGDKVRIILQDRIEIINVITADSKGFNVELKDAGEVFVYGKEVDDFRMVDYEAISMLNVSATQEQQLLIEALQKENAALKTANASLEARMEMIEEKLGVTFEANNK